MTETLARPGRYTMRDTNAVAREASRVITRHLKTHPDTILVKNVERDPFYQQMDVDLVWRIKTHPYGIRNIRIEIKADRLDTTGNFFFETWSNREQGTVGCFLYTAAEYLYYYFVETGKLYILPTEKVRLWFRQHMSEFVERETTTTINGGLGHYTTVGRLVPIARVLAEVDGVEIYPLKLPVKKVKKAS
ncbi:MAG: hypothetical protein KAX40_03810 [Herpetosiphon sp.]|nr:hypothetical protein [Herpetosiphon sp.]